MLPNPRVEEEISLPAVVDSLVPEELRADAWAVCSGKHWYFGNSSNQHGFSRFWKMDLDGVPEFDRLWEHARPRCELLAGAPLEVIRQYANGHTYGLGGDPHQDDEQPGTFTLLYYPNPEWKSNWDGETVYYGADGEILLAVRPKPNRAVFFDSRILHAGRAPSRQCPVLRVTVAYKLRAVHARRESAAPFLAHKAPVPVSGPRVRESRREGASRVYTAHIPASSITGPVEEKLAEIGASVRLPGFRPGKVPRQVLEERYGAEARTQVLRALGAQLVERELPAGSVASSCSLGTADDGVELTIAATHLPDLPGPDLTEVRWERLVPTETGGMDAEEVATFCRQDLATQVLDFLDQSYQFPLFPGKVEREFEALRKAAEERGHIPESGAGREAVAQQLRTIAERRLRLALVIGELGRRFGFSPGPGVNLEEQVIGRLLESVPPQERSVSADELRELIGPAIADGQD